MVQTRALLSHRLIRPSRVFVLVSVSQATLARHVTHMRVSTPLAFIQVRMKI
jgi:hypothetical protein